METSRAPGKLSHLQKDYGIACEGQPFFINEICSSLSDTVEMFELPIKGSEISVSPHFLLVATRDSLKIYKYSKSFTLKLKVVLECSYVLFMRRLLNRGARVLMYKVILALFERKITSEPLLKKHLWTVNKYLKMELIKSVEFVGNTAKIDYRCGKTFYFDSFFNLVEPARGSGDVLCITGKRMEVSRNNSVIVSKKVGDVLQCDRTRNLAFLLTKTSIVVAQFGHICSYGC